MSKETVLPKDMLKEKELAKYWGVTRNTLQKSAFLTVKSSIKTNRF